MKVFVGPPGDYSNLACISTRDQIPASPGIHMDGDIRIRAVRPQQRNLLIEMYDRFEPLGAALSLPPSKEEARREWIDVALGHKLNLAAFSPAAAVIGHCFLVPDEAGSAELAIFVHQEFRRRGVGTALVKAVLELGAVAGLRYVWSLTGSDNYAAVRLQERLGFRLTNSSFCEAQFELDLQSPVWLGLQTPAGLPTAARIF